MGLRSLPSARPAAAARRSPMSMATKASCSIAATRSTGWSSAATISKSPGCCSTASWPSAAQLAQFTGDITRHTMLNEQIHAIYRGFRRDAHPMAVMCGVVGGSGGVLSRRARHLRSAAPADRLASARRQDADDRGDGLQIFAGPALCLSEERSRLCGELPAYAVLGAVRELPAAGGGGAGARGIADHPGRPRAERLDLGDAAGRLDPRQPLCLRRGGDRGIVGAVARRRQRGGPADPAPRSARSTASRRCCAAPRTRTTPTG